MTDRKGEAAEKFPAAWLEAPGERARGLVEEAGERATLLVDAWIQRPNPAAIAAIAADDDAPALPRKAARRGLNVLKSRGVPIPRAEAKAKAAAPEAPEFEAWFRPPDASGTSAFTIGKRETTGRYRLADVIIKAGVGVVSVAPMTMSRTQLRESFDGVGKRFGHAPAEVPIGWARARIAAALRENVGSGKALPLGFDAQRDLFEPVPQALPLHPSDEANFPAADADAAIERSAKLHSEPELRGWLPGPIAMQALFERVASRMAPGVDKNAAESSVRTAIEEATDDYFDDATSVLLASHLKDAIISMVSRGATERAGDAMCVVRAIESRSREPSALPFLRGFFEKAFGLAAARSVAQRG